VRTASDSLKRLIFTGRSEEIWNTDIAPRTELPKEAQRSDAPVWSDALSIAIEMRSDLRQQRLQIDLAALDHELRENEKGPQLDLELGANGEAFDGSASSALEDSLSYANPTFSAALNYSIPLGNTGARNKLKSSWAALRAARLRYDSLETGAVRQIAYQADAVAAARQSIELAREQLKAEEARRAVDITTTFQVLQFQQDLLAALSSERAARSAFAKAKLALERAQGTLGDR
jgi:outer membrane protein